MHESALAARPADGEGKAPVPSGAPCVRVLAADRATPAGLAALHERLPPGAELDIAPQAESGLAALAAAARRYPGRNLVLVRADARLPELACERLLRAIDEPGVIGALPLDDGDPLATAAADLDPAGLDALCFACSERLLVETAGWPATLPAISAWNGDRLARLGIDRIGNADALAANTFAIVRLDHLYVPGGSIPHDAGASDPRDPPPPCPLEPLRLRLAAWPAASTHPATPGLDAKPVLLHILHGWGGGAERWVRDIAAADRDAHHLVLIARGSFSRRRHGEWLELHDGALAGPPLRRWPLPCPIDDTALADPACAAILAKVKHEWSVDAIVVSSLIGHSLDALRTSLPTFVIVHDHYPLWPLLHRDFGDPTLPFDDAQLERDLAATGSDHEFRNRDPAHWRTLRDATVSALVAARATLIAPSATALANERRLAPALGPLPAHVIPHGLAPWPAGTPRAPEPPHRDRLRLVVAGRIRRGKGAELLTAALDGITPHAELFLLGAGADAHDLFGRPDVHILLDYRRENLPKLIAGLAPDAALLVPTVAESFSYTLSEFRSLDVPVIATCVGALATRIRDGIDGFLVAPDAAALVAQVAALARDRAPLARVRAELTQAEEPGSDAMARDYTRVFALPRRATIRYPLARLLPAKLAEAANTTALAAETARTAELAQALEGERAESERRGEWGHRLDRELAERTRWAQSLAAELGDLKPRHEQMLVSRSWRMTAPLRRLNARLGGLDVDVGYRWQRLLGLRERVRGSLAQRGFAGTLRRIAQEFTGRGTAGQRRTWPAPREDATSFALPVSAAPRASIIIPAHGKVAYTLACLRSIAAQPGAVPFEVIVVDDASADATVGHLARVGGLVTITNPVNLGFIGSCNAGAAKARGGILVFLNNDTLVTPGWLDALVRCLDEEPDAGLVGAKLVYPDGRLQEAGGIVFSDGSGWNYGRFDDDTRPRYTFRRDADYCSGAAIAIPRTLFQRLGGFDARFAPAYYEDTDLAFAVRAAGRRVIYEPAALVVHFEGITSGTDTASGTKRYQTINRTKFIEKWRDALIHQPAPGTPPDLAATHRATRRVLIVDATTPTPDQDSGSLRMVNLMRVLRRLGCQVTFLPENRARFDRYTPALQALGVEALWGEAADPVRLFRTRGLEFDLVVLSRHYVAVNMIGLARLHAPRARLAFDTVDLHYLREARAAELDPRPEMRQRAARTRLQELKLIRDCDVTFVVSSVERDVLARDAPGATVEVLSNIHAVHGCRKPFAERRDLVFVGGFQHPPNEDAVRWFATEVFGRVRQAIDGVRLHVIGSKVPPAIAALADDGILVHGHVADLMPYMDGCRVSVAPLRYGAGVKGKVNMAMSCGLPVVATSAAVEGMHVTNGEEVLVADDAAGFADAVVRLYRDEALWVRLSAAGLDNVTRHFSFDAAQVVLARMLSLPATPSRTEAAS